jgi:hypothetical protein
MATTNRAVNVYLPKNLEQSITEYCTEYNTTRKDKSGQVSPAWGTAILAILNEYFNGEKQGDSLSNVSSKLLDEQIGAIKEEVRAELVDELNQLIRVNQEQLRGELVGRIEELEKMAIAPQAEELDTQPVAEAVPKVLEVEEVETSALATSPNNDDALLTAGEMATAFPHIGKGEYRDQKFRDWAKSSTKGGKGKEALANLGYESIAYEEKGRTKYCFRKIN